MIDPRRLRSLEDFHDALRQLERAALSNMAAGRDKFTVAQGLDVALNILDDVENTPHELVRSVAQG